VRQGPWEQEGVIVLPGKEHVGALIRALNQKVLVAIRSEVKELPSRMAESLGLKQEVTIVKVGGSDLATRVVEELAEVPGYRYLVCDPALESELFPEWKDSR
jgi:hypothetical protein